MLNKTKIGLLYKREMFAHFYTISLLDGHSSIEVQSSRPGVS